MSVESIYPSIRVSGEPLERGRQYGVLARDRILRSREGYERAFRHATGDDWLGAVASVAHLVDSVEGAFPNYWAEMQGIAEGSGLPFADIFTMNARTEVIWAAAARRSLKPGSSLARECTAIAAVPPRSGVTTYVAQNWDWLIHSRETLIVLEVEQAEAPNFVTVVEAGLLAKASLNSAGVGVAVNALVSSLDRAETGIPFHVLIRALADVTTVGEAIRVTAAHARASSGNYVVAHSDGVAVNLETSPGGPEGVTVTVPSNGLLCHANHFLAPLTRGHDLAVRELADSWIRQQRVESMMANEARLLDAHVLFAQLADHADFPNSLCCHPDESDHIDDRWSTVASIVMDLRERSLRLVDGNPCTGKQRTLTFGDFLSPDLARAPRPPLERIDGP